MKWGATTGAFAMSLSLSMEGLTISHPEAFQPSSWLAAFVGLTFFLWQVIMYSPISPQEADHKRGVMLLSAVSVGCGACVLYSSGFPGCGRRIQMRREAERVAGCLTQALHSLLKSIMPFAKHFTCQAPWSIDGEARESPEAAMQRHRHVKVLSQHCWSSTACTCASIGWF